MIRIEELDTPAQLEALEPEWSALWDACPGATPFQSPEWLIAWWDVFHPGRLAAIAVRENGRLAGLAPLYLGNDGVLRFIGTGVTDYLDVLAEPGRSGVVASAVLAHLDCTRAAWRRCDLLELRDGSPLLTAPFPAGLAAETGACSVCPVAPLPASPGTGLRRNLRRYRRRLNAAGETSYEIDCGAPGDSLEALFRLHSDRWHKRRSPGVLSSEPVREFHRKAAAGFAARGWLRMFGLRHAGALAAVMYAFFAKGQAYLYLSGFAPALSLSSPGVLLLDFTLNESASAGLEQADFLRGNEPYKYLWGARDTTNYRLELRPGW